MRRLVFPTVACVLAAVASAFSHAQPYPNRPIRFIVPSAPGGAPDISARMFAQEISRQMGQQVVVDNRAGASNMIGTEMVVKAPPDGYEIAPWGGIMAPAGLPRSILDRLNAEFNSALQSKVVQDTYAAAGVEPQGGTPEQFTEHVRRETEKWGTLIKRLGLKAS